MAWRRGRGQQGPARGSIASTTSSRVDRRWPERDALVLVNRLALVVVFGPQQARASRDRLRRLVGFEAQEQLLRVVGARVVAEAAGGEHRRVMHLHIFRIDGGDAIEYRQRFRVPPVEKQDAGQLIERDAVARILPGDALE